jgi:hypothetical protein
MQIPGTMTVPPKDRRAKRERRAGADRRAKQAPVKLERRKGAERRSGLERRLDATTVGDQLQAAIGLLTFATENGVMLDVDRWVLETAITRLKIALAKLGDEPAE